MNALKNILVPVDFSPGSRSALEQAVRLAQVHGAQLHVLHVVDSLAVSGLAHHHGDSFERQSRKSMEGAAKALDAWLTQSHLPAGFDTYIALGVPLHEILEYERKVNPDLLVAGIAGSHGAVARAGSVSAKIARKAKCNVLLVRSDHPHAFKHIIAGIDISDASREVAAQAHRIAVQDGAKVDFLHVWHAPWSALPYMVPMSMVPAELPPEYVPTLQKVLEGFVAGDAAGVESKAVLRESVNHATGIAEHAQESKADLIVISTKGRTNLRYVILGSTAEQLLTRLPCSLLVVKPVAE